MMKTQTQRIFLLSGLFVATLCAPFGFHSTATAGVMMSNPLLSEEYQFKFTIAAKRELLEYPGNETVAHMAAWDSPTGLMMARNTPFIELENTSLNANIESFTLSIGNPNYFYDYVQNIEMPGGTTFVATLLSPDSLDDGIGTSLIHFEFDNFVPGAVLRFQTQVQPLAADMFAYPDYREVLFDLNGSDTIDNAIMAVEFEETGKPPVVVQHQLEDYHINMPTVLGVGYRAYGDMDSVTVFGGNAGVTPIPEPSALLLCFVGVACLGARRPRRLSPVACRRIAMRRSASRGLLNLNE